jgi:sensor domain CHASE-containing protein
MLEVVQNIESRASISEVKRLVDERIQKIDMSHIVKDKVSFDDLYQYIKNGNMHNGNK